jgi:phenylalanyl-tRNA synthetase beta chain
LVRIGKVAPALLKDFDIDQECFYAEIELEFAQNYVLK